MRYLIIFLLLTTTGLSARDMTFKVGGATGFMLGESFIDRFDNRATNGPDVKLDLELAENIFLGLGYRFTHSSGDVFQYHNELEVHTPYIKASYNRPLFSWLRLYGGVDLGLTVTDYTFEFNADSYLSRDNAVGFAVAPHLGVEIYFPTKSLRNDDGFLDKWSLGLFFEAGYGYATPLEVSGQPEFEDDAGPGEDSSAEFFDAELGTLDRHGPYFTIGITLIF